MKKIIILMMLLFVIGCEEEFDNKTEGYSLHKTGVISDITYSACGGPTSFSKVQLTFTDGSIIFANNLKCDHALKLGEVGCLYIKDMYKEKPAHYQQTTEYIWIKNGEKEKIEEQAKLSKAEFMFNDEAKKNKSVEPIMEVINKITESSKKYKWISVDSSLPKVYDLVLIKLDDGIITTGRLDEYKKWKIEVDKNSSDFNKRSFFRVKEWKGIDVE